MLHNRKSLQDICRLFLVNEGAGTVPVLTGVGTSSSVTTVLRGPESNRRLEVMLTTTIFIAVLSLWSGLCLHPLSRMSTV
jgi:hypothetical protein